MNLLFAQTILFPSSEFDKVDIRQPQSIQHSFEALQATNDFEPLRTFKPNNRYRKISTPVGRLKMILKEPGGRSAMNLCTASIIDEDKILTNNHCLPGLLGVKVIKSVIEFNYYEQGTKIVDTYPVSVTPLESNEKLDYSILKVENNPMKKYGVVTLADSQPENEDSIFIIHHPAGKPKILSRKDCRIKAIAGEDFYHTCDTLGGSSGSPIFSDNTFELIGLHFAGSENGNVGKRIEKVIEASPILKDILNKRRNTMVNYISKDNSPKTQPVSSIEVILESAPYGATVFLGDTYIGATPIKFAIPKNQLGKLTLKKGGFHDAYEIISTDQVVFKKKIILKKIELPIERTPVRVRLVANADKASVFYNGVPMGVTPLDVKIIPVEKYNFEIKSEGYESKTVVVTGKQKEYSIRMNKLPAAKLLGNTINDDIALSQYRKAMGFFGTLRGQEPDEDGIFNDDFFDDAEKDFFK